MPPFRPPFGKRSPAGSLVRRIPLAALGFLAPAGGLFALFVLYPIGESIRLSLYRWDGIGPKVWLGIGNYLELFGDPVFYTALSNNLLWLLLNMLAPVLGLGSALLLNQAVAGIRLARSLFFLPFVISPVVVGLVFGWFFHSHFGLLNQILERFGAAPVAPLDSERWAIVAVILAGLWPQTAYCTILYLTGLMTMRSELIDAARLDGARGWFLLRQVVLPELRPVTFIVVMVCIVSALRSFDLVMIMTGGGPYDSSTVLAFLMYERTFLGFRYGYGAALATILFLLMAAGVGFFLWRLLRREAG